MENNIKLFTVGPAQMYQHTLDVRSKMVPYFRTSEFSNIMLDNCEMLKETMNAPKDADVIVLMKMINYWLYLVVLSERGLNIYVNCIGFHM